MKETRHLEQAEEYSLQGEYQQAIRCYSEAIRVAPKAAPAWYGRGYCHAALSDYQRAVADFTEAIRLDPTLVGSYAGYISKAFRMRAEEFMNQRDFERALEDFNEGIRLQPESDEFRGHSWYRRGMCHIALGNYAAALADFDAALGMGYTGHHECVVHIRALASRLQREQGQPSS
jgi:tetratricopeptide (TPR) repeat protein